MAPARDRGVLEGSIQFETLRERGGALRGSRSPTRVSLGLVSLCALPTMVIKVPAHIINAARDGQTEYVLEELARRRLESGPAGCLLLLACCGGGPASSIAYIDRSCDIQPKHVDLARALLDRGADLEVRDRALTPLAHAARGLGEGSVDMVALILDAGGTASTSLYASLLFALRGFEDSDPERRLNCQRIVRMLLRAGAPLTILPSMLLHTEWPSSAPPLHYLATKQLILDLRAAGSPQAYRMESRKRVLLLRSLALKGRAEARDARMRFLVDSPNEIAWKVLEYWRTELDC